MNFEIVHIFWHCDTLFCMDAQVFDIIHTYTCWCVLFFCILLSAVRFAPYIVSEMGHMLFSSTSWRRFPSDHFLNGKTLDNVANSVAVSSENWFIHLSANFWKIVSPKAIPARTVHCFATFNCSETPRRSTIFRYHWKIELTFRNVLFHNIPKTIYQVLTVSKNFPKS